MPVRGWRGRHGNRSEDSHQSRSLAATQGPVSLSSAGAGTGSLPSSRVLQAAVWGWLWVEGGVYPSCSSYFEATHQTAEVQPWAFLMPSSPGIHVFSSVMSRMPSVGAGGFRAVWHMERPSGLAGAAGHCNGLRSLVLPDKGKWNNTYSSYLQHQLKQGNWW